MGDDEVDYCPNAVLDELRDLLGEHDLPPTPDEVDRAAELFSALDEWLSKGGFLPTDWTTRADVTSEGDTAAFISQITDERDRAEAALAKVRELADQFAAYEAAHHDSRDRYSQGVRDAWDLAESDLRAVLRKEERQ